MTTTSADPIIAGQRRWGASWAGKTPAEVAALALENRAKFGALQDELNRACRQAGRVFSGPVADALAEICQGLDSLYVELDRMCRLNVTCSVREAAVKIWSEPAEGVRSRAELDAADRREQSATDTVPPACLACGRFPCACDLTSTHVD